MNQLTHLLDNSNVYGSDDEEAKALRTFKSGQLNVTARGGHRMDLLPPDNNPEMECTLSKNLTGIDPPAEVKCFKAGTFLLAQSNKTYKTINYGPSYRDDDDALHRP